LTLGTVIILMCKAKRGYQAKTIGIITKGAKKIKKAWAYISRKRINVAGSVSKALMGKNVGEKRKR